MALIAGGCAGTPGASGERQQQDEIVMMVASSLAEVAESVADRFNEGDADGDDVAGVARVAVNAASSAALVAQLEAGADADVLITADAATMRMATEAGLVAGEPTVIASNALVLAAAPGNPGAVTALADLARPELVIGLCDSRAPCGALADRGLRQAGIEPSVDTFEANAGSLTVKVALGELDAGLLYATDARRESLPLVDAPELIELSNAYHMASVAAEPAPAVRAVLSAFTEPDGVGAKKLLAQGFGPP